MPHWGRIPKLSLVMIVTPRSLELAVFTEACGRRDDRVSEPRAEQGQEGPRGSRNILWGNEGTSPGPTKALVIRLGHCWSLPLSLVQAVSLPLLSLL